MQIRGKAMALRLELWEDLVVKLKNLSKGKPFFILSINKFKSNHSELKQNYFFKFVSA